jgi:hypothetical protein
MADLKFQMLSFHLGYYMFHLKQFQLKLIVLLGQKKYQEFFLKVVLLRLRHDQLNQLYIHRRLRHQLMLLVLVVHYLLDVSKRHRLKSILHKHYKNLKGLLQLMELQ